MYILNSMKHSPKTALKISIFLLGFCLTATTALAQTIATDLVPSTVRAAFEKSQSNSKASWSESSEGNYTVRFYKSGHDLIYVYSPDGKLKAKKKLVNPILIPNSINTHLASNHSSYEMKEVFQVISRSKEKYYEVEAGDASSSKQLRYSLAGAYVSAVDLTSPVENATLAVASTPNSNLPQPASTGGMRGDDDGFEDIELIDDDIADLFEEEEEDDILLDPADSNSWEDILFEEEEEDDLGDWDIPEGDDL